eukprot:Filipodium_phascolosomae@DN2568_c0_g2_i1.p1
MANGTLSRSNDVYNHPKRSASCPSIEIAAPQMRCIPSRFPNMTTVDYVDLTSVWSYIHRTNKKSGGDLARVIRHISEITRLCPAQTRGKPYPDSSTPTDVKRSLSLPDLRLKEQDGRNWCSNRASIPDIHGQSRTFPKRHVSFLCSLLLPKPGKASRKDSNDRSVPTTPSCFSPSGRPRMSLTRRVCSMPLRSVSFMDDAEEVELIPNEPATVTAIKRMDSFRRPLTESDDSTVNRPFRRMCSIDECPAPAGFEGVTAAGLLQHHYDEGDNSNGTELSALVNNGEEDNSNCSVINRNSGAEPGVRQHSPDRFGDSDEDLDAPLPQ